MGLVVRILADGEWVEKDWVTDRSSGNVIADVWRRRGYAAEVRLVAHDPPDGAVVKTARRRPASRRRGEKVRPPKGLPPAPTALWTPQADAMVGTDADSRIARRLGVTGATVRNRRIALGRPRYVGPNLAKMSGNFWTPERCALLGKYPDREVARRLSVRLMVVTMRRQSFGISPAPETAELATGDQEE